MTRSPPTTIAPSDAYTPLPIEFLERSTESHNDTRTLTRFLLQIILIK